MDGTNWVSSLNSDLDAHMGNYTNQDNFLCIFCSHETNKPLDCLIHMKEEHNFLITNLPALSLLNKYLDNWRFHPQPFIQSVIYGQNVQTIDPDNEEEIELRRMLHKMRLEQVMQEYEIERTKKIDNIPCLFCKNKFSGTWQEYLQWMFEQHRFNPGRPQNLIYIPQLIDHLRNQINNNICIHCQQQFNKPHLLRTHMKKKPHDKIPDSRFFDRFYMVNYLEAGKKWQDIEQEGEIDDDESKISIEEGLKDFDDDTVVDETQCLVCDTVLSRPEFVIDHMLRYHRFDLRDIQAALDKNFYKMIRFINYARSMKKDNRCFVCRCKVTGDYAEHIHSHDNKKPADLTLIDSDDQLLIPVIKEDPLLTVLEDL